MCDASQCRLGELGPMVGQTLYGNAVALDCSAVVCSQQICNGEETRSAYLYMPKVLQDLAQVLNGQNRSGRTGSGPGGRCLPDRARDRPGRHGQCVAGAARFAREGSILARLAHPQIARLLDAGVAPGQQPYLVLDCVDGLPIDQFCDASGLAVTARVRLCLDVLDAVAHAHTRLILHRDIKPSNILVSAHGDVKLLDFGIAKLLDDPTGSAQATELTRESGSAFTMLYAAPEQVQGGDVSTTTDVYALGVLLHLLLTGLHPGGVSTTPMERMRALVEVVPPPMSVALRQAGDPKRARPLRGDLDTIVAKALKKLPAALLARTPTVGQRVFDHAQSVYGSAIPPGGRAA